MFLSVKEQQQARVEVSRSICDAMGWPWDPAMALKSEDEDTGDGDGAGGDDGIYRLGKGDFLERSEPIGRGKRSKSSRGSGRGRGRGRGRSKGRGKGTDSTGVLN